MIDLQPAVAVGLGGYARSTFRVHTFGLDGLRLEPGTIIAPSHRSDDDVPVLVSVLHRPWAAAVGRGLPWPTFGATDDLFLRGFLAGYPPGLPLWLRRLLWPIRVGGPLERALGCVPVRRPARMLVVELLRCAPDRVLDATLPSAVADGLRDRAVRLGHPEPILAADVLRGAYADLLGTRVGRGEVTGTEDIWRAHLHAADDDFRSLSTRLRAGAPVVIFPEGIPSADGEIGPLRSGLTSLAHRGRARLIQPIAIACDPLVSGRSRAYVSVVPAFAPPTRAEGPASTSLGERVTAALRAATTLTPGQPASTAVRTDAARSRGMPALEQLADQRLAGARADGRPIEPALADARTRRRALGNALREAQRRGAHDPIAVRLARELESASRPLESAPAAAVNSESTGTTHTDGAGGRDSARRVRG